MSITNDAQPLIESNIPSHRWFSGCALLVISQCFERIGYIGLTMNLLYLLTATPYGWSSYNSSVLILLLDSTMKMFAVVGSWISDALIGKFYTIIIGYFLYIIFSLPIPFLYWQTWNGAHQTKPAFFCVYNSSGRNETDDNRSVISEACVFPFMLSLIFFAMGASLVKVLVIPLGADQVAEKSEAIRRSFVNWYYFSVNVGTFLAFFGLGYVQNNISIFWGLFGAYIMLFMSSSLFAMARPFLTMPPAGGSRVKDIFGILFSSAGKSCSHGLKAQNQEIIEASECSSEDESSNLSPLCLNHSKRDLGGNYDSNLVEDVKKFLHILLIFCCYIFYYAGFFQKESLFNAQGLHMRIPFFTKATSFPVVWLNLFDSTIIVIMIPILDYFVYPWLMKHNRMPKVFTRILIGFSLSTCAIIIAGFMEKVRYETFWGKNNTSLIPRNEVNQKIGDTIYHAANMSLFYLIPQYTLLGMGEVFANLAGLEYAYEFAPTGMSTLMIAIYWFFGGLGSLFSTCLIESVRGHFIFSNLTLDINYRQPCTKNGQRITVNGREYCSETHLDFYFFILAGFQTFGIILFCGIVFWLLPHLQATVKRNVAERQIKPVGSYQSPEFEADDIVIRSRERLRATRDLRVTDSLNSFYRQRVFPQSNSNSSNELESSYHENETEALHF